MSGLFLLSEAQMRRIAPFFPLSHGFPGVDATDLKAHRTAASLLKRGLFPDVSGAPKAA